MQPASCSAGLQAAAPDRTLVVSTRKQAVKRRVACFIRSCKLLQLTCPGFKFGQPCSLRIISQVLSKQFHVASFCGSSRLKSGPEHSILVRSWALGQSSEAVKTYLPTCFPIWVGGRSLKTMFGSPSTSKQLKSYDGCLGLIVIATCHCQWLPLAAATSPSIAALSTVDRMCGGRWTYIFCPCHILCQPQYYQGLQHTTGIQRIRR